MSRTVALDDETQTPEVKPGFLRDYVSGVEIKASPPGNRWHTADYPITTKVVWLMCQHTKSEQSNSQAGMSFVGVRTLHRLWGIRGITLILDK